MGSPMEISYFAWFGSAKSHAAGSWSAALALPVLIDGQEEGEDLLSVTFRSHPG